MIKIEIVKVDVDGKNKLRTLLQRVFKEIRPQITPVDISALISATWFDKKNSKGPTTNFNQAVSRLSLQKDSKLCSDLLNHGNGFTAFYKAYRGSVDAWVEQNFVSLCQILDSVYNAKAVEDLELAARQIEELPNIYGTGKISHKSMKSSSLITPIAFCLDRRNQFPVVNERKIVRNFLDSISTGDSLENIVMDSIAFQMAYGYTATDLDCITHSEDLLHRKRKEKTPRRIDGKWAKYKELDMKLKDSSDTERVRTTTETIRRLHNGMINRIVKNRSVGFLYLEGKNVPFDLMINNAKSKQSLLIEVKSSCELDDIRMAVGQVHHYRFMLGSTSGKTYVGLGILLPNQPSNELIHFLRDTMGISVIWEEISEGYGFAMTRTSKEFERAFIGANE